jgi:hypothetical protein
MAKKKKSKAPPQPAPIDYGALMAQAGDSAQSQIAAQGAAQSGAYADMLEQMLGAVSRISANLDNEYTGQARGQLDKVRGDIDAVRSIAGKLGITGDRAQRDIDGTEIERELTTQAKGDLLLGRRLSPEEERAAQQSARSAFSARGMGTGNPSASAEVLNRDAFATQRQDQRRQFASAVNQMNVTNEQARLGLAGSMYGQQLGGMATAGQLGTNLAHSFTAIDPYQRALNSNLPGQVLQGSVAMGQMAGNAYDSSAQVAGQVAGFNANMLESRYNSWMNNQAGLRGGQMQASAAAGAARDSQTGQMMQMAGTGIAAAGTVAAAGIAAGAGTAAVGGGAAAAAASAAVAGAVCWVARAAFGDANPEWLTFRSWLLRRAPAWLLRAYARHGERAAEVLRRMPWARPLVRGGMRWLMA